MYIYNIYRSQFYPQYGRHQSPPAPAYRYLVPRPSQYNYSRLDYLPHDYYGYF